MMPSANAQQEPLQILVRLTIKDAASLQEFETAAVRIMARYEGRLLSAFEVAAEEGDPDMEVHLLEFPNQQCFDSYRRDPELVAMGELRSRAVSHTEVMRSSKLKRY